MAAFPDSGVLDGGRSLPVAEDFYTVQGEGRHAGRALSLIHISEPTRPY